MSRWTLADVLDYVRAQERGRVTNTDVARRFRWSPRATTRGLERLVGRGVLRHVLASSDPTHQPHLYEENA